MNTKVIKINLYEAILCMGFFLNIVFICFEPIYNLISPHIVYILGVISLLLIVANMEIRLSIKNTIIFSLILLIAILALKLNRSGIGNIVQLIWPITIASTFRNQNHDDSFFDTISRGAVLFLYVLVLKSILIYSHIDKTSLDDVHDAGVINPNVTGLAIVYLYLCTNFKKKDKSYKHIIRFIASIIGLIMCDSRAPMIALIIVMFLKIFCNKQLYHNKGFVVVLFSSIIICGALFPFVYVYLFKYSSLNNVTFLGKNIFTGRQWIWMNVMDYVNKNPIAYIIGTGYNTSFYKELGSATGKFNLHNAYIMLFAQYGLIVTVVYLIYILSIIFNTYNKGKINELKFNALQIVLVSFIVGFGETTLSFIIMLFFPGFALGVLNTRKENNYRCLLKK